MVVMDRPLAYRVPDAARALSISERTLWTLIGDGRIKTFKNGPRLRFISAVEIERYIRECEEAAEV